jgi:hypothetical protein
MSGLSGLGGLEPIPPPQWVGQFAFAGYRDGQFEIPSTYSSFNIYDAGEVGLWGSNAVVAGVTADQAPKINAIIETIKSNSGPTLASPIKLVLPAGTITTRSQILLHCSFLTIAGHPSGTTINFLPNLDTRYDVMPSGATPDGDDFDLSVMSFNSANGGWIFPGRAAFRVGPIDVHPFYAADFAAAPSNRKDFFYGSVNFPWRTGIKVLQTTPYPALKGSLTIPVDSLPLGVYVGGWIILYGANTKTFYDGCGTTNPAHHRGTPVVRTRIHRVTGVSDTSISIWPALEFDIPRNQEADGDVAIDPDMPSSYYSMVVPLTAVRGVGIENITLQQPMDGVPGVAGNTYNLTASAAKNNYSNLAPEYAMVGFLLRWCVDCWVKGCSTHMTGSHALATEFVSNCSVIQNSFDGAWNKGPGGNGYVRFSKASSCMVQGNILRNLRHLAIQWSSSHNVFLGNDIDADVNFHGGRERFTLVEANLVRVPFEHRYGTIGADPSAGSVWYPVWWGAGAHAGKWASASGEGNILFNNRLSKQFTQGGPYEKTLYSTPGRLYFFGVKSSLKESRTWEHLSQNSIKIPTWGQRENVNFYSAPNTGVQALTQWEGSLYKYAKRVAPPRPFFIENPGREEFAINSVPSLQTWLSALRSPVVTAIMDMTDFSYVNAEPTKKPTSLPANSGIDVWRFSNSQLNLSSTDASRNATWIIHFRNDLNVSTAGRLLDIKYGGFSLQLYPQGSVGFTGMQFALFSYNGSTWSFVSGITTAAGEIPKGAWGTIAISYSFDLKLITMRIFGRSLRTLTFAPTIPVASGTDLEVVVGQRRNGSASPFVGDIAEIVYFDRLLSQMEQFYVMDSLAYHYQDLS